MSAVVPPYAGQEQQWWIPVPATTAYRLEREESCWVMPPYALLYPQPPEPERAMVPPPLQRTHLWSAQQTWPL